MRSAHSTSGAGCLGTLTIAAMAAGYREFLAWAVGLGEPAFALEGTGGYGAGLARLLAAAGWRVFEVERPERQQRRRGKSDALDGEHAARRLLAGERLALL